MDLVKVYIIRSQPAQGIFHFLFNTFPPGILVNGYIPAVIVLAVKSKIAFGKIPPHPEFCQQLYAVAGQPFDGLPHNFLTGPLPVYRRGIYGSHPGVIGTSYGLNRLPPVAPAPHPAACCPGAKGDHG